MTQAIFHCLMFSNTNFAFDQNESNHPSSSIDLKLSFKDDKATGKKSFKDLVITRNRPTNVPCLSNEVRANADAIKFGDCATLLLNNTQIGTDIIVKNLIRQMLMNHDQREINVLIDSVFNSLLISNTDRDGDFLQFAKTINGFEHRDDGTMTVDPSWLIAMASLPWIEDRIVGITTMIHPINMGAHHSSVQMLAIVLTPIREKSSKSDIETSRNIAAVLSNVKFRQQVQGKCITDEGFRRIFKETTVNLQNMKIKDVDSGGHLADRDDFCFGKGIYSDLKNLCSDYSSDYTDAFSERSAIAKTITTIFVLFFANLLPTIAFGMLNEESTKNKINIAKGLIAQVIGGVGFAIFGGQRMVIMLTTSPLSIMIMVFYNISLALEIDFFPFYTWIGIFNAVYLCVFAFTGASRIMRYSRRSIEETFALFVSATFVVDAVKSCVKSFKSFNHDGYYIGIEAIEKGECLKEESLLFLLLLLGTMAVGLWLNGFSRTPYLNSHSRKIITEFSLPVSILFMSFIGSYVFREVKMHTFGAQSWRNVTINVVGISDLSVTGSAVAAVMAFPLSILFFMEQNIASSILNSKANNLKKASSYHWDILVIGILNLVLSILGLPWVHGALPHSPMHLTALAKVDDHVDDGNHITRKIVKVVETRIPALLANILIGCCIFLMPYPLIYIPAPVLNGLFLYMAFTTLNKNQLFERLLLFITEQSAYPPNHYLKRVPQRTVHLFTFIQALQLMVLCIIGFTPIDYVKMTFPFLLILQLPFRHLVLPKLISKKYLKALDRDI